jgi:hypothetical protein
MCTISRCNDRRFVLGYASVHNQCLTFSIHFIILCYYAALCTTVLYSPVVYNAEESFCSLNFASRVRTVELGKASRHTEDRPSISTSNSGTINSSSSNSSTSGAAATRSTSPMAVNSGSFSSTGNSPMQPKPVRKR